MTSSVFPARSVAQAGFLAGLDADEIGTVLSYTQWRRYTRGELAIRAGEDERSLYVITAGRFEVWVASASGRRRAAILHTGELFGELAFFDGQPRSADVEAIEDSEARIMTPASFDRLRLTHPRLALCFVMDLGRILSVRFREHNLRLAEL
jgi:CRP/FNR family transcriptional regulator, cyclic AMP receptor protein